MLFIFSNAIVTVPVYAYCERCTDKILALDNSRVIKNIKIIKYKASRYYITFAQGTYNTNRNAV